MTKRTSISMIAPLLLALAGGALGACHTVAGAGEDLSAAGQAVTRSAEKAAGGK